MKTSNHGILIKSICILLIMLVSASSVMAYPPDNAAVLYYRAFLVMKEPSEEVKEMRSDLRGGKIKSNDQIKQYIEENRRAIELLETAAEIPNCDWGHDESEGFGLLLPELGKIRQMAFPLVADAQTLSQNGQHKAALNKCMTLHRMAFAHILPGGHSAQQPGKRTCRRLPFGNAGRPGNADVAKKPDYGCIGQCHLDEESDEQREGNCPA
jgi:hypothetical protein